MKVGKSVGEMAIGGPFNLVDVDGKPVSDQDFRGKYMMIYFGFTHCPDICPTELTKVGEVMEQLGTVFHAFVFVPPVFIFGLHREEPEDAW